MEEREGEGEGLRKGGRAGLAGRGHTGRDHRQGGRVRPCTNGKTKKPYV
jgi:hypothetical protein